MDAKKFAEMLIAAMNSENGTVSRVAADAGDNAADACRAAQCSRFTAGGSYSREFVEAWIATAKSLLSFPEWAQAAPFFAEYGIAA